ncbi:hypothetical protein MAR_021863 [Mya arenaria]|uniref:Uncharacterized protein n=1 Tax=Mya arenaria TaxID=6604 RepID=A0ABY7EBD6_MYAAR|nr:uncharacterized protein LOC128233956 [Mya arenaria]WAR06494.1 hypothetical protein MAR_021863 [Mya arenaria]
MNKLVSLALVAQCACVGLVLCYGSYGSGTHTAVSNTGSQYMYAGYPMITGYGGGLGAGYGYSGFSGFGMGGGVGGSSGYEGIFGSIIYLFIFVFLLKFLFPSATDGKSGGLLSLGN